MTKVTPPEQELSFLSRTMLMTLFMRAQETERENGIIHDPKAADIVRQMEYDFEPFQGNWITQTMVATRTEIMDEITRDFLRTNPAGTIVTLAAGLDTRISRLDNGQATWYDVDFPNVISFRRNFFEPSERHHFIGQSVLNYAWPRQIETEQPLLFIAEGVLMYFWPVEAETLFNLLGENFPGAHVVADGISPFVVRGRVENVNRPGAAFRWGITSFRTISEMVDNIEFLEEWFIFERYKERWRWLRLLLWFPPFRKALKVGHLRVADHGRG